MHRALQRKYALLLRFDADMPKHFLIRGLTLLRREHDAHAVLFQDRHFSKIHAEPMEHRPGAGEATVPQLFDAEFALERNMARHT